jgi:hypothetical protein
VPINWEPAKRISANRQVLSYLETQAAPPKLENARWDIDAFELHSHPDLTERLIEVTASLTVSLVAAYGVTCIGHSNGVVFGFVRGGFVLFFRLRRSSSEAEPQPEIGSDWFRFDAFPSDPNKDAGTAALMEVAKESWDYAGSLGSQSDHDDGDHVSPPARHRPDR